MRAIASGEVGCSWALEMDIDGVAMAEGFEDSGA